MEGIKNKIKEWFVPGMVIIILSQTIMITRYLSDIEARTLDTIEMKVRLQDHMRIWTPETQLIAFQRLKAVEDSSKLLRKQDSLATKERDEIKEILRRIEKKIEKIN